MFHYDEGVAKLHDPTPVPTTCTADPYTTDRYGYMFNATAEDILSATPLPLLPGGAAQWNMSTCKARCCAASSGSSAAARPSPTNCRAVALLRPRTAVGGCAAGQPCCLLYRSPLSNGTTIVRAPDATNASLGWVMWRTPTPGECSRFSGAPEMCAKYSNANCHLASSSPPSRFVHEQEQDATCLIGTPPAHATACKATLTNGAHDSIWGMHTPDWGTLALRAGLVDAEAAMKVVSPYLDNTRVGLRNQWNWAGVQSTETTGVGNMAAEMAGQPFCTAHYWFHLTIWHLPAAISGLTYSAIDAEMSFAPALQPPYTLPVFVPGAVATFSCSTNRSYALAVVLGRVRLRAITAPGANWTAVGGQAKVLAAGASISWSG
jgi:hypothetical protein